MQSLKTPIEQVPKINRRILPPLSRLGIRTLHDLLFHFPTRYEDFSNIKKIADVASEERVTIEGKISAIKSFRTAHRRMHITEATIEDESGSLRAVWFNQPFLERTLKVGNIFRLSGKVTIGSRGISLQNPAHERVALESRQDTSLHTGSLVPIYPETAGITSRWLRFLIKSFIHLRSEIADPIPQNIRSTYNLIDLETALYQIHFPKKIIESEEAKKRFAFEELLLIQLRSLLIRARLKSHRAPPIPLDVPVVQTFVKKLPFALTNAQRRSLWEILRDLEKSKPMNRLLEGDVGSGKTVVAAAASLLAAKNGYRVLFMAPTEILAHQHHETIEKLLSPFGVTIGILTGSEKKISHLPDITVGTHALIQKHITFKNLGLVVIDEQHRFGVEQRAALVKSEKLKDEKAELPHFLSMSATPIPRTLALTIYGDLDLSIIDELPKSRKTIETKIVSPGKRNDAYEFIRKEVRSGRQVFIICPKIEIKTNETSSVYFLPIPPTAEVKAVKEEFKRLTEKIFPDLRMSMLHGKMKPKEKNEIMQRFKNHETDILVSTSVIEVGVDVPNATIMVIEGAERFGLAQLHQFRGRVGRGVHQSYCLLFPTEDGTETRRLRAIVEAKNGFELAEKDLAIRGAGDLFGSRQSGIPDMALANITNVHLVREVRDAARDIVMQSPDLQNFPVLAERLREFENAIHLE